MTAGTDAFYDAAWRRWGDMIRYSPAPRLRRERILAWLAANKVTSVLDVGCGNGEFLLAAQKALPGVRLAGCDVSPEVIERNRAALPGIEFHVLDLNHAALEQRFDAVVCTEVVEHCDNYRTAIGRLAAMSSRLLAMTVPCGPLFPIDRMVGHIRHFQADEIARALTESGLPPDRTECWGFPFFNLYKHAINLRPEATARTFLSDKPYSPAMKAFSLLVYGLFRLSLPLAGYQLFAFARRRP